MCAERSLIANAFYNTNKCLFSGFIAFVFIIKAL